MCDFEKINVGQLGAVGQSFLHLDLTRVAQFSLASFEDWLYKFYITYLSGDVYNCVADLVASPLPPYLEHWEHLIYNYLKAGLDWSLSLVLQTSSILELFH